MYNAWARKSGGKLMHNSLSAQDPEVHNSFRKPIAAAYSLSALMPYEPLVDDMTTKFLSRLRGVSQDPGARRCDMALWLRLCK